MIRKVHGGVDWTVLVVLLLVASGMAGQREEAARKVGEAMEAVEAIEEQPRRRSRMGRYLREDRRAGSVGETKVTTKEGVDEVWWDRSSPDGLPVRSWR